MNVYIPPIIEKVYNVQGSTAAPGSGEYHRYRAMRRRERTIAAAMEKEYDERKQQKEFEEKKEMKKQRIETERLKKKRRRDKKEDKKELKKKFLSAIEVKKNIFRKDVPLIDQLKNELGEEEYEKLYIQENNDVNELEYEVSNNYLINNPNGCANYNTNKIQKGIKRNDLEILDSENQLKELEKEIDDQTLVKLFPALKQKEFEFENYDDYEEHLQILEIIEKNEKLLNQELDEKKNEPIKYKEEEENIIIHDYDSF